MSIDKYTEAYNRLMFGGDYELIRVKDPATDVKGHGGDGCFLFIQEVSGKIITQTGTTRKILRRKINDPTNPVNVKPGGFIRRADAAKYLGISLRTLTDWQQKRIIPFVDVSHRVTLFRIDDLNQAMKRFIVKAIGDET